MQDPTAKMKMDPFVLLEQRLRKEAEQAAAEPTSNALSE
jgi:hypothetical protein